MSTLSLGLSLSLLLKKCFDFDFNFPRSLSESPLPPLHPSTNTRTTKHPFVTGILHSVFAVVSLLKIIEQRKEYRMQMLHNCENKIKVYQWHAFQCNEMHNIKNSVTYQTKDASSVQNGAHVFNGHVISFTPVLSLVKVIHSQCFISRVNSPWLIPLHLITV
jgi:hypothetical protein